ncbi:uncharacterized protein J8A68_003140 [[Candida] subhashii]|uniref:Carboxypeptidase n=1 Tax=[Candida] subhashii TaxID=561895 RepID=A0A8J5QN02_9ASCO|nr:uncharacterized protein J8A68_003140 [[Candida] subhashii]KAG7663308.1 hypothetical protein J8A68_003140 [[Candida] subhashii]
MKIINLVFALWAIAIQYGIYALSTKDPKLVKEHARDMNSGGLEGLGSTLNSRPFDYHVFDKRHPNHKLRVRNTDPEDLGIDTVKQYSGYLDVEDEDKHFFYWFFESRNDPKNDPVILWLNGGPGCSSMMGLLFELGPASIDKNLNPKHNPYSWNNNASVIFLDQPVNVGFSHSSNSVNETVTAGKDVYAFLELFFKQFPEYSNLDFHIAGESYAGHYIPAFATEILSHDDRSFNLTSILIGNPLTDPLVQYEYYKPMACGDGGADAVLSSDECRAMEQSLPICLSLTRYCYENEWEWSCIEADNFCTDTQFNPYALTGRNPYDVRIDMEGDKGYIEMEYDDEYLNKPEVMKALGVEVEKFNTCNSSIHENFASDVMRPFQRDVQALLAEGLPVLIYAGDKDFVCNWLGNEAWTNRLIWEGHSKFVKSPIKKWEVDGRHVGDVTSSDNFTFLRVFNAGHMVPHDQPENALDMINRWISGDYAFT